jgi:uncharacterized membrane protein
LAEKEQETRLKLVQLQVEAEIMESKKSSNRLLVGLFLGFILGLAWIALIGYLIFSGNASEARWIAGFAAALAGVFVFQKNVNSAKKTVAQQELPAKK